MTIRQAVEMARKMTDSDYDGEIMTHQLQTLDGQIQLEVMLTSREDTVRYDWERDGETELLVEPPYDTIYPLYLAAQIDFWNAEYDRYQNSMAMFEEKYSAFVRWFADRYAPGRGSVPELRDQKPEYYITAYALAVKAGFRGTLDQWLESLHGFDPVIDAEKIPGGTRVTITGANGPTSFDVMDAGPVHSVNGKTGAVELGAGDVGARPDTWTPNAKDVGAWPDTAVPENGSVVGSDAADAQGWYDAGVLGPLQAGYDVSAVIAVQHLYDNRAGILSVRVRRQTDGTYYGHCRILSGSMLDPSWYYISVDGDGVAHLIVWINARYDHAKLTVLAQEDRAAESGGKLRWEMRSSGTKITKPAVTISCALNTAIIDAGVAEITVETENTAARVYVGFKAGFTSAPAVVTAVTDGAPGAQVSSATVTEKGCWIYAVKATTGTVKVAWTAAQV